MHRTDIRPVGAPGVAGIRALVEVEIGVAIPLDHGIEGGADTDDRGGGIGVATGHSQPGQGSLGYPTAIDRGQQAETAADG